MKKIAIWFHRFVIILVAAMIVVDGALYLRWHEAKDRASQDTGFLYRASGVHGAIPPPDGYTSKAVRVDLKTAGKSGWLVRYAAKGCEFCQRDEPSWMHFSERFRQLGYDVITVVPNAQQEYANGAEALTGSAQEAYVNMDWIKRFRLTGTPTLLVFSVDRGLIWVHVGTLEPDDLESAVRIATKSK